MCGAVSLNGRMGVQPQEVEFAGAKAPGESLRTLFGLGASALKKWFKTSGTWPSLVVEVIAPVITAVIALHHLPVSSGYNRCSPTHRGLSTWRNHSVTGWPAHQPTCGR